MLFRLERLVSALRSEAIIKWNPLDNLHITTKFIGEWPDSRLEELDAALISLPGRPIFDVEIRDLGWFPNERSPRILWAGVQGADALLQLANDTEASLEPLGVKKEERAFSPHLTLARIKNPVPLQRLRRKVQEMQPASLGAFPVSRFVLYQSEPGSNASSYHKLREYQFESSMAAGRI